MPRETCDICGRDFYVSYAYCYTCPECKAHMKYTNVGGEFNLHSRELRIKADAEKRAKNNDRIIAEGYAERQIAQSLKLAGKVRTEL